MPRATSIFGALRARHTTMNQAKRRTPLTLRRARPSQRKAPLFAAITALSIAVLALASSCGPVVPDTPQAVGQAFLTAYRDLDFKQAQKYATDVSSMTLQLMDNMKANLDPKLQDQAKARGLTFAQVIQNGDTAQLYYTLGSNDSNVLNLVREDGRWKVDFKKEM